MKTHRGRGERAWEVTAQATTHMDTVKLASGTWASPPVAIAYLTYPTELVKAATGAVQWMRKALLENVDVEGFDPNDHVAVRPLLDALALYDPPGEPGKLEPTKGERR